MGAFGKEYHLWMFDELVSQQCSIKSQIQFNNGVFKENFKWRNVI